MMRVLLRDSVLMLLVRVGALLIFIGVVINCVTEFLGRPFLIETNYKKKLGEGLKAASDDDVYFMFPDVIICSQEQVSLKLSLTFTKLLWFHEKILKSPLENSLLKLNSPIYL